MDAMVRVLFVEDSPIDVELECRELKRDGLEIEWRAVASEPDMRRELRGFRPDVVLSDFTMPEFSGLAALQIMRASAPETPLIFVSGTIGEEMAVRCLREGATDYILKGNLARLGSAVRRALDDVTQAAQARKSEQARDRLVQIVESTSDIVATADPQGRLTYINEAGCRTLGVTAGEAIGQPVGNFFPEETRRVLCEEAVPAAREHGVWQGEASLVTRGGAQIPISQVLIAHGARHGQANFLSGIARDMRERKAFEARIQHLAHHDALTGLPNRELLRDRATQALVHARRSGRQAALLQVHVDNFALVNESFGHLVGDRLLEEVGQRLRGAVRDGDTVARTGAEEFSVLLTDLARVEDSRAVGRKILDGLRAPMRVEDRELRIGASIGVALHPADGEDFDQLLRNAGTAMRRASAQARGGLQYYAAEMTRESLQRIWIETGLEAALERRELALLYQPQFDIASRRITGVEALMRWYSRDGATVSPASFIPVAEESGLIQSMGEWALGEACRTALGWARADGVPVRVAVNVSPRQLGQEDFASMVAGTLESCGFPPERLELEITESAVMGGGDRPLEALRRLKALGVKVAMDDFGTGYSSLSHLSQLPLDRLKVDRSFVRRMGEDARDAAIVQSIVALGHGLGLSVVAEGVETPEQLQSLAGMGCDEAQGFLLAKPISDDRVRELLGGGRQA